jgi:hypothetical protein
MPIYRVSVVLNTNIETSSPEMARRIALEGAMALVRQDESASTDFNSVMPQDTFPKFTYEREDIDPEDLPAEEGDTPTEDGLDNSEEVA